MTNQIISENMDEFIDQLIEANKNKFMDKEETIDQMSDFEDFQKKKDKKIKGKRNAYIFFCSEKREEVKRTNQGIENKDILRKLGALWKEIKTEDTKEYKKFVEMAEKDKKRYEDEKNEEDERRKAEMKTKVY